MPEDEEGSKENMAPAGAKLSKSSVDGLGKGCALLPLREVPANSLPPAGDARFHAETAAQSSASKARWHRDLGSSLIETAASSNGQSSPQWHAQQHDSPRVIEEPLANSLPPARDECVHASSESTLSEAAVSPQWHAIQTSFEELLADSQSPLSETNSSENWKDESSTAQRNYSESPPRTTATSMPNTPEPEPRAYDAELPTMPHPQQVRPPLAVPQSAICNEGSLRVSALPTPTAGSQLGARRSLHATNLQLNNLLFDDNASQLAPPQLQYVLPVMLRPVMMISPDGTIAQVWVQDA